MKLILIAQRFLQCPTKTSGRGDKWSQEAEFPDILQTEFMEIKGGINCVNIAYLKAQVQPDCPSFQHTKQSERKAPLGGNSSHALRIPLWQGAEAEAGCLPPSRCLDASSPRWWKSDWVAQRMLHQQMDSQQNVSCWLTYWWFPPRFCPLENFLRSFSG